MLVPIVTTVLATVGCGFGWLVYKKRKLEAYSVLHTSKSASNHYLILIVMKYISQYCRKIFEKDTKNFSKCQEQFLLDLLKNNQETEYGKQWKFSEIKNREDYVKNHPITNYDHYQAYMDRIANNGEKTLISNYKLDKLAISSGTSGSRKLLPSTTKQKAIFFFQGIAVIYNTLLQLPGLYHLQKTCKFMYNPTKRVSPAGIPMGANSSSPEDSKSLMDMFATPAVGYLQIKNEKSAIYVHWLFALKDVNLGQFEANFISIIYNAFCYLEIHWRALVDDIEKGKISNNPMPIEDQAIVKQLEKRLGGPDPKRAKFLFDEFSKGMEGIAPRIWPNLRCLLTTNTGGFQLYQSKLHKFVPPAIPTYSPLYGASEGLIAINLTIGSGTYVLVPRAMFFEFIPIELADSEIVFADQVEVGKSYEVIITTVSGLYRYRLGDVVKVVGFYNSTPLIEFLYRQGQLLNVRGEKTSEVAFYEAIKSVQWPTDLVDFTSIDPLLEVNEKGSDTPFYTIYVELKTPLDAVACSRVASEFDRALQRTNPIYQSFREKDSIGAPVIHGVASGTFEKIRLEMINAGTGINQVKIPRVVRTNNIISILHESQNNN